MATNICGCSKLDGVFYPCPLHQQIEMTEIDKVRAELERWKSACGEYYQAKEKLADDLKAANLQNGVLLTYIERVRKNVSSDNICDCHGRIGEPHKKDCLLIALYALDGCICGVKFGGIHLDDCPGKKVESLGAGLTDESQREANKLKAEVDRWVERSQVAEDKAHESNRLNERLQNTLEYIRDNEADGTPARRAAENALGGAIKRSCTCLCHSVNSNSGGCSACRKHETVFIEKRKCECVWLDGGPLGEYRDRRVACAVHDKRDSALSKSQEKRIEAQKRVVRPQICDMQSPAGDCYCTMPEGHAGDHHSVGLMWDEQWKASQ